MLLSAGQLRHQLEVQRVARKRGEAGGSVRSWVTLKVLPGWVEPLAGRQLAYARQEDARTTHRVRVPYVPGLAVTAEDRLVWKDRDRAEHVLAIVSVKDVDGRGVQLELACEESRAKGTTP